MAHVPMPTDNALTPGARYDVDALRQTFFGWWTRDGFLDHVPGYFLEGYFDRLGRYLGPDVFGIEPLFAEPFPHLD